MVNAEITRSKENNIPSIWVWLWVGWQANVKSAILGSKCDFNLQKIRTFPLKQTWLL